MAAEIESGFWGEFYMELHCSQGWDFSVNSCVGSQDMLFQQMHHIMYIFEMKWDVIGKIPSAMDIFPVI